MERMSKREATRQALCMVIMEREPGEWAIRPHRRYAVGVIDPWGKVDYGRNHFLSRSDALRIRRELVAYWTQIILSGNEVANV